MRKTLLLGLIGALAAGGCGESSQTVSGLQPALAQTAPVTSASETVEVVSAARLPDGQTLELDLQVTEEEVQGDAALVSDSDIQPFLVTGSLVEGNYSLRLLPDDVATTESLELSGSLQSGSQLFLSRPGAGEPFAEATVDARPLARVHDRTPSGGEEEYELFLAGSAMIQERRSGDQFHRLRLKFDKPGLAARSGTWQYIDKQPSRGGDDGIDQPQVGYGRYGGTFPAIAHFGLTAAVRLDLYYNQKPALFNRIAAIWFRPADSSFFAGGLPGSQVGLDPDSSVQICYFAPEIIGNGGAKLQSCEMRPYPSSYIKLLNLAP